MMQKTIIALVALAAVGSVHPTATFARGGGGAGHGGSGQGSVGRSVIAPASVHGGKGFHGSAALGGTGLRGGSFHVVVISGGARGQRVIRNAFHRHEFGPGFYDDDAYYGGYDSHAYSDAYDYNDDYYYRGGCDVVRRRLHTSHGWRVRPIEVCG